jgi:hypothetical protein
LKLNFLSYIKNLEKRLFIGIFRQSNNNVASITPLGLAYIRQIEDENLRIISDKGGITR